MPEGFSEGDYVRNGMAPYWGIGKVLEPLGEKKLRVFFEYVGEKTVLLEALLAFAAPEDHPVLARVDRMRDFKGFIPFPSLESFFLKQFSDGFADTKYQKDERAYKEKASAYFHENLSREILQPMLEQGEYAKVCDLAKKAVSRTNLVHKFESIALGDGLKRSEYHQELFATALYDLLYGETGMPRRFSAFVEALTELDACKWTTATYFLYLLDPTTHIFVKPEIFKTAAKSYAIDFGYTTHPDWDCYQRILDFVQFVAGQLAKRENLKPCDLIDVQSFIWCSLQ